MARVRVGIITPPPIGERTQRSVVMTVSVCLYVCLSVCLSVCPRAYPQNYMSDLHRNVTYARGSVLLWWRCDALCTSGFMDDVMFVRDGQE